MMQGIPGHQSSLPSNQDHHLRMLDMAAYRNHGPSGDGGLILDQYNNSFNAAAALYSQFPTLPSSLSTPRMNEQQHHQAGYVNGMIKLEVLEGAAGGEQSAVTNVTSASGEVSGYSSSGEKETTDTGMDNECPPQQNGGMGSHGNGLSVKVKAKRKLPGMPDPDAEVVALSPRTLLATNRFVCEICNKGFQRDQNLQLHRRGHNLPWKLKQRGSKEVRKKVYVCPEASCVHHDPARALGDLTGIKKHFSRKHGEKKWKCDKCNKRYAVQSDWKAHSKTCGTKEYRCDCGTLFSRRDSFITHRAFCDALAEETALRVHGHQIGGGDHHLPSSLSSAVAAHLAQNAHAGALAPSFSSLLGGGTGSDLPPKAAAGLLDHIPSYDNALVNGPGNASSASSASRHSNRLPLWLSAATAAAGDPHQLLNANSNNVHASNNPAHSSLFSSFHGGHGSAMNGLLLNNSVLQSPSMFNNGTLFGPSSGTEFDLIGDTSGNPSFASLQNFNGLTPLPSGMSNSLLSYGGQPHASGQGLIGDGVHPSSSQVSATALLQKTAQMGNPNPSNISSLFKNGGSHPASMAAVSSTDALYWPSPSSIGHRTTQGISVSQLGPNFSNFHSADKTNTMMNCESGPRMNMMSNMDNVSAIQEMVASFNNGGGIPASAGPGSSKSLFMGNPTLDNNISYSKGAPMFLTPNNQTPFCTSESSRSALQSHHEHFMNPNHQQLGHPSSAPVHGFSTKLAVKSEDVGAAADNFTRDFLGVRGDNSMLEGLDKALSHRADVGLEY
ncbi:hypothetical protein KP509_08G030600 [Ceratopteris richardii]|uniref:C2H2-type domain-containing protein n=1 Tax=Ceratopteris richardii TaxID=49495 RepID=A0A8T2U8V6_CERRI|nr:hypothetical protein KP509_08G030600 [Ceratopteris richardii]